MKFLVRILGLVVAFMLLAFSTKAVYAQTITPDITGGITVTQQGKYPFVAYISGDGYSATGVLINNETILTCAHCLNGIEASRIAINLGGVDRSKLESGERFIGGIESIPHPLYKKSVFHFENEVRLITIFPITETVNIKPIQIYTQSLAVSNPFTVTLTLIGWGKTESGRSNVLREVTDAFKCSVIGNSQLNCRGQNPKSGICNGDSGGPVIMDINGIQMLVALAVAADQCDDPQRLTVIVDTSKYLDWMNPLLNRPKIYLPSIYMN